MTWRVFLKYLVILTICVGLWALGISGLGKHEETIWIYGLAISGFFIFSILIFLYAYNTSASDNLFSFNNVVSASFLLKLIMSIGMIILYEKLFDPDSSMHVIHFIIVYIVFTIYEVYFLTKLARSSP